MAPDSPSSPLTSAQVRARLAGPALDKLVTIGIEHLLERPIDALIDPDWVAQQVQLALETASRDDATRRWVQEQVRALRAQVPAGTPRDHLPGELVEPLYEVVGRPMVFDRALVGRLLDHDAARHLVTDILTHGLQGFADKLKPMANMVGTTMKQARGFDRFKRLSSGVQNLGDGLLGGMSRQLEHKAEQKIRLFVDEALHAAMDQVADHLCDPANASRYGGYRTHLLGVVLDTNNQTLARELEKLDTDHLVDVAIATARSVSQRDTLRTELAQAVRRVMDENDGRTVRDWLRAAGVGAESEDAWRASMQKQLTTEARVFVDTPAFTDWIDDLLS